MPCLAMLLLVAAEIARGDPGAVSVPTFQHLDPEASRNLTCARCPAGTRLAAPCTATRPTECAPCRGNHYTESWNFLPRCLYCSTFCGADQVTLRECSPTGDRVCGCREGRYNVHDFCVRHTECPRGHGVKQRGTPFSNTVCEQCSAGSFSAASSSLEPCVPHRRCPPVAHGDRAVLLHGTPSRDTVCGPCVAAGGRDELIRSVLTAFFNDHKMKPLKMRTLLKTYMWNRDGRRSRRLRRQRGPLLFSIRAWLSQAPGDELVKVPGMLRNSALRTLANKLEEMLDVIQETADCL